jgi:site-specific recombinase XerD
MFAGNFPGKPLRVKKTWAALSKPAAIENVRLHDLQHRYASHLVSAGMSLAIVGCLFEHTQP